MLKQITPSWGHVMGGILKLDSATLDALEKVARASGKSPSSLARKALRNFLEDYWDMLEVKRRECSGEKPIPWARVKQNLGMER